MPHCSRAMPKSGPSSTYRSSSRQSPIWSPRTSSLLRAYGHSRPPPSRRNWIRHCFAPVPGPARGHPRYHRRFLPSRRPRRFRKRHNRPDSPYSAASAISPNGGSAQWVVQRSDVVSRCGGPAAPGTKPEPSCHDVPLQRSWPPVRPVRTITPAIAVPAPASTPASLPAPGRAPGSAPAPKPYQPATHAHGGQKELGEELSLRAGPRDGTPVIETRAAEIH